MLYKIICSRSMQPACGCIEQAISGEDALQTVWYCTPEIMEMMVINDIDVAKG
jgi:hypothetical protein